MNRSHAMPFGAELLPNGTVRFRLWAPGAQQVTLHVENSGRQSYSLTALEQGWFELITAEATAGSFYRFQIDGRIEVPDPASRFQPQDVNGPSQVVAASAFEWSDDGWKGHPWEESVIYELHVGTFTSEGTFRGVEQKLDYLRDLGITAIELMPVADFSGTRNWGYDGVLPFAPDSSYGSPDDLKRLIQAAHAKGLMIFLDVVYNHFGPEGNYLHTYAPQFFTSRHRTPWGDAINFDGAGSRVVRDFFIHNALFWLEEYHFDGLRLDAVNSIVDDSKPDILTELAQTVRERFGQQRFVHLILENEDNRARYLRRSRAGAIELYTAQWNDDIHHAMHVLLTGESDGYYSDYIANPICHLSRCLSEGFAYQGGYSEFHASPRGEPSNDLPPSAFISFLQNHDQIGNRAFGERIAQLAAPNALKAAMEILLLAPQPPMLFMGEEFGATTPFYFFCDFHGDLAAAVTTGRRNEFARFEKFNSLASRDSIPDPNAEATFMQSKLNWGSVHGETGLVWLTLYRELLRIRRTKIVPHLGGGPRVQCHESQDPTRSLAVDWVFEDGARIELRANLGAESVQPHQHSGNLMYASERDILKEQSLGAWSVAWYLTP